MAKRWLKLGTTALGLVGLAANYGYHHQNHVKHWFRLNEEPAVETIADFVLPVGFEHNIDIFCFEIETSLAKHKKKTFDNGIEAQGNFKYQKDGRPEGKGVIISPSQGFKVIGNFSNGQLEGMGAIHDEANHLYYKGVMHKGALNGLGVLEIADDFGYKGNFVNSKPKGSGKYVFKDGRECVITGAEKPDEKDFAICVDETKALKYRGEWEFGNFNGVGKFYFSDGGRYEGEFKDGQMHGQGQLLDKYGDIQYKGEFKEDVRQNSLSFYSEPFVAVSIVVAYILVRRKIK